MYILVPREIRTPVRITNIALPPLYSFNTLLELVEDLSNKSLLVCRFFGIPSYEADVTENADFIYAVFVEATRARKRS